MLPGSLSYRFLTKEDLVVTLGERAVDHALGEVQRAIEKSDDVWCTLASATTHSGKGSATPLWAPAKSHRRSTSGG